MATGRMITLRTRLRGWGKGSRCGRDLHSLVSVSYFSRAVNSEMAVPTGVEPVRPGRQPGIIADRSWDQTGARGEDRTLLSKLHWVTASCHTFTAARANGGR